MTRLVRAIEKRPASVLFVFALAWAALAYVASGLTLRGDFLELLPPESPEVRDLRFVESKAGSDSFLVVQVTGGQTGDRRAFAAELAAGLEGEKDLIRYVDYKVDTAFFERRALWFMPAEKLTELSHDLTARIDYEKAKNSPFDLGLTAPEKEPINFPAIEKKYTKESTLKEYIESKDGSELYLYVKATQLASDLDFDRRLIAAAEAHARTTREHFPNVHTAFTGPYVILLEENAVMGADIVRAGIIALVLSLAILLAASRRVGVLPIVAIPVGFGIAAAFAFARLIVGHLNPVTGFLGAILIGIGVEHGVHLTMRYREERRVAGALAAMERTVLGTFSGALTSAATNAAAFFVLVFADLPAFRQFGQIAAFGVIATFAATYIAGPALLFLGEKIQVQKKQTRQKGAGERSEEQNVAPFQPPRWAIGLIFLLSIVAVVYSIGVFPKVGFATDLKALKGDSPATALEDHIHDQQGVVWRPAVLFVSSLENARAAGEIVQTYKKEVGDRSELAEVVTIADLLPSDVAAKQPILAEIERSMVELPARAQTAASQKLADMARASPWIVEDLPIAVRRRFTPTSGEGTFVLIFPKHKGYDSAELARWAAELDEVKRRIESRGIDLHIMDGNRVAARIMALIQGDGPRILLLASVMVFAMIALSLRSVKKTLVVVLPLFAGLTCLVGAMFLWGVSLNFLNVVVLPSLLTIAVDNSVHIYHRYEEEGTGRLGRVMQTAGASAAVATCSNATGYAALLVARHAGLRSVGVLSLLGVLCAFWGTTVLFPALLFGAEHRR
ncbi:MAG: MMPL family transporter [Polyangiaceae bacterium]|nr:MMPL family transporter [Polyangiaceae bacterium]